MVHREKLNHLACAHGHAVTVSNQFNMLCTLGDSVELWDTSKREAKFLKLQRNVLESTGGQGVALRLERHWGISRSVALQDITNAVKVLHSLCYWYHLTVQTTV